MRQTWVYTTHGGHGLIKLKARKRVQHSTHARMLVSAICPLLAESHHTWLQCCFVSFDCVLCCIWFMSCLSSKETCFPNNWTHHRFSKKLSDIVEHKVLCAMRIWHFCCMQFILYDVGQVLDVFWWNGSDSILTHFTILVSLPTLWAPLHRYSPCSCNPKGVIEQSLVDSVQPCNLCQICRLYGACSHRVSSNFRTRDACAIGCASLTCLSPLLQLS